jgi:hypothetical protein
MRPSFLFFPSDSVIRFFFFFNRVGFQLMENNSQAVVSRRTKRISAFLVAY